MRRVNEQPRDEDITPQYVHILPVVLLGAGINHPGHSQPAGLKNIPVPLTCVDTVPKALTEAVGMEGVRREDRKSPDMVLGSL